MTTPTAPNREMTAKSFINPNAAGPINKPAIRYPTIGG